MTRVCISSEGARTLRNLADTYERALSHIEEGHERLTADVALIAEGLGELESFVFEISGYIDYATGELRDIMPGLANDLRGTAAAIEQYLEASSIGRIEDALFLQVESSESSTLRVFAAESAELADCLRRHAHADDLEQVRSAETQALHRHPRGGGWYDASHRPISADSFNNEGTFYWRPDQNRLYGGVPAQDILRRYGLEEIEFRNGYPVFSEHVVLIEIGLPDPLTQGRYGNFRSADDAVVHESLAGVYGFAASERFNTMAEEYLHSHGSGRWFESVSQMREFREQNHLTWHEKEDMMTMQLIPSDLHALVSHDGGVSNARLRDKEADELETLARGAARMLSERSASDIG